MKTAVEWLASQIEGKYTSKKHFKEIFEQAKEMEKKQIIDAWNDVGADGVTTAEEYYKQNFKNK